MSSYLFSKSFRRKGFLLFILFLSIANLLFSSINIASSNLNAFSKESWANYVGDLRLSGSFNEVFLNALESHPNVEEFNALSIVYSNVIYEDEKYSAMLVYVHNPDGLMGYSLREGNSSGVLFLTSSSLKLKKGDVVSIVYNQKKIDVNITGIASALHLFGIVNLQLIVQKDLLKSLGKDHYDLIFVKLKKEDSKFTDELKEIASKTGSKIESILIIDKEAYPGKEEIKAASSSFTFFSLLSLFIIFVAMVVYQLIYLEMNREEIIYLKTIGFTKRDLVLSYISPLLLVLVVSSLIGSLASVYFSRFIFDSAIRSTPVDFSGVLLSRFVFKVGFNELLYSNFIIISLFLVSLTFLLLYLFKRKEELVKGFRGFRTANLRLKLVLFSSFSRLWALALTILLFALIISSTASVYSLMKSWDSSIKELNSFYDYFIYGLGDTSKIPEIPNASIMVANFHFGKVKDVGVVTASFLKIGDVMPKLIEGRWNLNRGEAIVSLTLARTLNVKVGDTLRYSTGTYEGDFKVVGIAFIPLLYLYTRETEALVINYEDYKSLFGNERTFVVFLKGNLEDSLKTLEQNGFVVSWRTSEESVRIASEGGRIALIFLNFLSLSLAFSSIMLVGIIAASEIYSKIRYFATLILLGLRGREILLLLFASMLLISLASLPLSYPLYQLIASFLKVQILSFTGFFEVNISFFDLLTGLFYIIIPSFLVVLIAYRVLKKINLVEILRK